jgi:hypothetical protein
VSHHPVRVDRDLLNRLVLAHPAETTTVIRQLISRGTPLTADSPPYDLAWWRATALVVLSAICPPDELVWKWLRPDTAGSPTTYPPSDQSFAEGWATTLGILEGLVAHLPPAHQTEPLRSPERMPTAVPGHGLYRPVLRNGDDPLQTLAAAGPVIRLLGLDEILGTDRPHPDGPDLRRVVEAAAFIRGALLRKGQGRGDGQALAAGSLRLLEDLDVALLSGGVLPAVDGQLGLAPSSSLPLMACGPHCPTIGSRWERRKPRRAPGA